MKKVKLLLMLIQLITNNVFKRKKPISVLLSLTGKCNFKCVYCYGDYNMGNVEVPLDKILSMLDQMAKHGVKLLKFTGGEPLMHQNIEEIAKHADSLGMELSIITNCSLVPKFEHLLKYFTNIGTSLDSLTDVNDRQRGEGALKATLAGIECLKKNNIKFGFNSLLTTQNIGEIDHITKFAKDNNCQVEFNFLHGGVRDLTGVELSLDEKATREAAKYILELKRKGEPIALSEEAFKYCADWPLPYDKQRVFLKDLPPNYRSLKCIMGYSHVFIDFDGGMYHCNQIVGEITPPNVYLHGYKDALKKLGDAPCEACWIPCFVHGNFSAQITPSNFIKRIK